MKRLLLTILALIMMVGIGWAEPATSSNRKLVTGTIAASGDWTQPNPITLSKNEGFFSVQSTLTGTGTAKIEYLVSNDGITYVTPSGASDIVTAQTVGSDFYSFNPEPCKFMKLKVTETGTANSVSLTLNFLVQ